MRRIRCLLFTALSALILAFPVRASEACPEPIHPQEVQTTLDEVANAYASVEYDQAYQLLAQLEGRLSCQAALIPGALLHRLFQLKGAVALATGAETYAGEQLEQAQRLAPTLGWDQALGAKGETLWEGRKRDLKRKPMASLKVTRLPRGVELALDGQRLKVDSSRQVIGGTHLVQVQVDGALWKQQRILVPAGFAWQLEWRGEELLVLPERKNAATRTLVGGIATATLGVSSLVSAGIYIPAFLDCEDSCDRAVLLRGLRARDVFIPSLAGTALSAGFTWLLPTLLPDGLAENQGMPRVSLSVSSDAEAPLAFGLRLSWQK